MSGVTTAIRDLRGLGQDALAWVCIPLIVIGCAVPFINVGVTPFWADESIAVLPALNIHVDLLPTSPFDLDYMPWQLKYGLWDPATPLYRYSVAAFTALTGFSESTTRAFSLLMGFASAVPLYALVRKLYGRRTALLTVTFLVTSPTFMIFARQARHFTFLTFLIVCTFYYLYTATEGRTDNARGVWFVFLVAALLSQTMGYFLLPIVALYMLLNGPARFVAWRHWRLYVGALSVYLGVIVLFWETLPFFHNVSCSTRPECLPMPWYYLAVLYMFVAPMAAPLEVMPNVGLSLLPLLFLLGFAVVVNSARTGRAPREKTSLILLWFLLPLGALSLQEVKFDRYLFIWVMPLCALFMALGVTTLLGTRPVRDAQAVWGVLLALFVVLSPQLVVGPKQDDVPPEVSVHSAWWTHFERGLLGSRDDNWERIRWQAKYLRERLGPGDVVVSSLDDASLQYYLGQFTYGFLNSRRTDEFFESLLDEAERTGTRLWFIDTLPKWNFCLSGEPEPWRIDCQLKYPRFYARCRGDGDGVSPACMRVPVE
jgi:4-amino-4-deoxy-L-arabinose transferase-like glycosyltransferase